MFGICKSQYRGNFVVTEQHLVPWVHHKNSIDRWKDQEVSIKQVWSLSRSDIQCSNICLEQDCVALFYEDNICYLGVLVDSCRTDMNGIKVLTRPGKKPGKRQNCRGKKSSSYESVLGVSAACRESFGVFTFGTCFTTQPAGRPCYLLPRQVTTRLAIPGQFSKKYLPISCRDAQ